VRPGTLAPAAPLRRRSTARRPTAAPRRRSSKQPTAQHDEYVVASRRTATRRQRRRTLATLGVALVLAVTALIAHDGAVAGKREALSRTLAAQTVAAAERDPALATALGLEAERIAPTADADSALARELPQLGESLGELRAGRPRPVGRVQPGRRDDRRRERRRDAAAVGRRHARHDRRAAARTRGTRLERRLQRRGDAARQRWPGSDHAAVGRRVAARGGRAHARAAGQRTGVGSVAFSPEGTTVAAATFGGTVALWDVRTRRMRGAPLGEADTSSLLDGEAPARTRPSPASAG
jgi:hypothetical protein